MPTLAPTLPRRLDWHAMRSHQSPIDALQSLSNPTSQEARQRFYGEVYQDPALQASASLVVQGWVSSGRAMELVREAFHPLMAESEPIPASASQESSQAAQRARFTDTLAQMRATRAQRWNRVADKLGVEPPTHFHLHRGVRGTFALAPVLASWRNQAAFTTLPHHELTSWSLDRAVAEKFAAGADAAVLYEATIPIEQTVMDKWADGDMFVTLGNDQQEVVVGAPSNTLKVPSNQVTVLYGGESWQMADADRLLRKLAEDKAAWATQLTASLA